MNLKILSALTATLFVISLGVFYFENLRGTDLVEGSDYIKGLDIGKIQKISLSFSGNKNLTFNRDGSRFVIENHKSYPASTEKINDLIYKIASIQVKKKVTSKPSKDDLEEYKLDAKSRTYFVEIYDNDNKKTVSFYVGKSHKNKGNYLYKENGENVYLSKESIRLQSSYQNFVITQLLDVKKEEIEIIQLTTTDTSIELAKKDKDFILVKPEKNNFKKDKAEDYFSQFSNLRFDEFYQYNDKEVQKLSFDKDIKIHLKNKLTYKLSLSKKKDDHFIKVNALINHIPNKITINTDKEKLKEIGNMAKAQAIAKQFNLEKGTWIYKIDRSTFEKLDKKTKDFL